MSTIIIAQSIDDKLRSDDMYNTSEHHKQLTLIYSSVYKRRLEEARIIRKQMACRCRQNYEFPAYGILFGSCPIIIGIIVVLFID
jgi:hypothetical protein